MLNVRNLFGIAFVIIGILALGWFADFSGLFLFLSPDGNVTPFMMLSLQLCLISLAPLGLVLIFYSRVTSLLVRIDGWMSHIDVRRFLVYVIAVGLLLRLAAVTFLPFDQSSDFASYDELAWQWALRGGYYGGEHLTAYWPPAYPFFLSRIYVLFGHVPRLGAIANVFLALPELLLSFFIMKRVFDERVARWTLLVLAFFPSQILFTHLLSSEALFKPLLLLSILLFLPVDGQRSKKWYVMLIGGFVLGMATLTRAISKFLLLVVVPFWWLETRSVKRTIRFTVLALVGFLVVVAPWMVRNYHVVGVATINTNTGINLFIGNQPGAGMGYNKYLADQFDVNGPLQEAYVDSAAWHRAKDYILERPGAFLVRGFAKLLLFYAADMDALWFGLAETAETSKTNGIVFISLISQLYWILMLMCALPGLIVFLGSSSKVMNPGGFLLLGIIGYWTAIHFVFYGLSRYHFPIIPMLSAFAALYIKSVIDKCQAAG